MCIRDRPLCPRRGGQRLLAALFPRARGPADSGGVGPELSGGRPHLGRARFRGDAVGRTRFQTWWSRPAPRGRSSRSRGMRG
eukprot:10277835-Alexandrium_andersonii.AAC.1